MTERFGALPLGELHAEGRCAYCGRHERILDRWNGERVGRGQAYGLKRTVLPMTQAVAHVCVDIVACERRRYRKRNP